MECRYQQLEASKLWQLTVRGADRCGRPQRLGRITTQLGRNIRVPRAAPGDAVLATFSVSLPLSWHVDDVVLHPPDYCVRQADAKGQRSSYQFVLGTQGDFHIMRPASTLGYTAPYIPTAISTFSINQCGVGPSARTITVQFYKMRFGA